MPPTRITVVHEIAAVRLLDREHAEQDDRAGGEEPGDRRRHAPVASSTTMPAARASACFAPGPERHRPAAGRASGSSTTSTSGSSRCSSSAPHAPCSSSVSPTASTVSPGRAPRPCRWTASTTRSPLSVTMPGNTVSPISPERGGITTSATPDSAREAARPRASSSAYCSTSVRAWSLKSRVIAARRAVRQQPLAEEHDDRDRPDDERDADERELEEAERARPRRRAAASETITFTGVPVSASSEPACAPNASGISSCDGERPSRTAITDDDRQQRGDRAVDADQRRQDRDEQHHQHDQPRAALARRARSAAARPRPSRRSRRAPR